MRASISYLEKLSIIIFILMTFFITNDTMSKIFLILFFISNMLILALSLKANSMKIDKGLVLLMVASILFLLLSYAITGYGIIDGIRLFAFLIIAYMSFYINKENNLKFDKVYRLFYIITLVFLLYYLIYNISNNLLWNYNIYLPAGYDKNFMAVIIFLYFCLCNKRKYLIGQIVSLIYIIILQSRMVVLGFLIYSLIKFIIYLNNKNKILNKFIQRILSIKTTGIYNIIIISNVFIIIFSFFVVKYIPLSSMSGYQESLMDNSTAVRVRANVYAVNRILDDPRLIFLGYGDDIKKVLGVEDIQNSTEFLGVRLVQPHNLLLNSILRYGIIISAIYLFIISKIIRKYWNKENLPIITAYIFMNLFVPFLFSREFLIFFLYVLYIQTDKKIKNNKKEKYNEQ